MVLPQALSVQGSVVPFDREKFMAATHGHSTGEWLTTRDWLGRRLHQVARDQKTTTYGELCSDMATAGMLRLEPHSSALAALLGQVNILEHEAGRPLITAVVVHKGGDMYPGVGFWNMARDVGVDPGATEEARLCFWVAEFTRCHTYWKAH
jgi:hypothetical protein